MANLYSSENEVFVAFSFYAALLIVKMTLMSFLTARQRFRKGVKVFRIINCIIF